MEDRNIELRERPIVGINRIREIYPTGFLLRTSFLLKISTKFSLIIYYLRAQVEKSYQNVIDKMFKTNIISRKNTLSRKYKSKVFKSNVAQDYSAPFKFYINK